MAEGAPIMLWVSDQTGRCLQINPLLRQFWGVEDVATFDWSTTLHPDDLGEVTGQMRAAVAAGTGVRVKGRYRRSDGAYRVLRNA